MNVFISSTSKVKLNKIINLIIIVDEIPFRVVCLYLIKNKRYAMLGGGYLVPVSRIVFNTLSLELDKILK